MDAKGRFIMPQRFRDSLSNEGFVITRGMDRCLFVFLEKDFAAMETKFQSQPPLDRHTMRLERWFSAEALDGEIDAQGRVAIPQHLREFAEIKGDVVIAGAGARLEIWGKERWEEFNKLLTDADISQSATEIGLGR